MKHLIASAMLAATVALAAVPAGADSSPPVHLRGEIDAVTGSSFALTPFGGQQTEVDWSKSTRFASLKAAQLSDIKPGMFVGATGQTQPDGSQKAIEVHIFPESMRGTGEGHYDWDLKPKSKMTNGNVEQTVAGVDGPMLSVKYTDGEKKLLVTPETVVVTYVMGSRDEIKPGTRIFVAAAKKQPDGTLQTPRITYGRNGAGPAF